jgi:Secretory lipase
MKRVCLVVTLIVLAIASGADGAGAAGPALPSSDPFYRYSGHLAGIAPGTVLRQRAVTLAEGGMSTPVSATQVLYRTTGELGQATATVATVIRPAAPPLLTRIVSYQTAYDALGSQCDPSYTLRGGNSSNGTAQAEEQVILAYVGLGDTVVVPDYEGERLDWGAGQESGYGTLDGIRAAEHLLKVPAHSTRATMVGYSGGSIATEFATELASTYAPELDLVGAAEGGIPVDFFHNLAYVNGSPSWSGVIPAVLLSVGRAFGVSFTQFLSPYGLKVARQVRHECINSFLGNYPGLKIQKLLQPRFQNVLKLPAFVQVTNHLIMSRTGTPKMPLFIGVGNADGTGDGVMISKDVEALAHTYCKRGVSVQFNQYDGDDHTNAAIKFEPAAITFVTQRLAGVAAMNGCGSIGPGNSLAPVPSPRSTPGLSVTSRGVITRLHGFVVVLRSTAGTWPNLVVALRRHGRVVAQTLIHRLSARRQVVLRHRGHAPSSGHYTLAVSEGFPTLFERRVVIR